MAWSVLGTIASVVLCCFSCFSLLGLITGIVAIVFSSQVNSKVKYGDLAGAIAASKNAKLWNWITTGILIASLLLGILILATGIGAEYSQQFREALEQAAQQSK